MKGHLTAEFAESAEKSCITTFPKASLGSFREGLRLDVQKLAGPAGYRDLIATSVF
jgi:hypothetical protein